MKKLLSALVLGISAFGLQAQAATFTVPLGSTEDVTNLYSYPNNCAVICYRDWTLAQTVEHYLNQSLLRDGYPNAKVSVGVTNGQYAATFRGDTLPPSYGDTLTTFLNTGKKAFSASQAINADKKWEFNWLFFLPHGMAMQNHQSVELLHFPPDYSLTQAQDYLNSKTTYRWDNMLEANGIPASKTPLFQTVIDLAPIAAPASAGSTLEGTYDYYTEYANAMLENWTVNSQSQTLPMVAFGSPVRKWIENNYKVSLSVGQLSQITLPNKTKVPVVGSNHPSYIWYVDEKQGPSTMQQDAIVSCWQARMGEKPTSDPTTTLSACTTYWQGEQLKTCEMYYVQAKNMTEPEAEAKCTSLGYKNDGNS